MKIRDRDGPRALAGFGSAKGSNEEAYLFQKLVRTGFGTNNVDHCTRLCHASSVAALLEGDRLGGGDRDLQRVQEFRRHHRHRRQPDREPSGGGDLLQAGGQARRQADRDGSARPGAQAPRLADGAVQDRHRRRDAQRHPQRHHRARSSTTSNMSRPIPRTSTSFRRNVKAFTPEEMSPICGIEPDVLRNVARTFARAESAIIFWGMGVSQHTHGTDNARCLIALSLICGQVGRPGTGLHPLRGQNNVQGASDAGLIPMFFPGLQVGGERRDPRQVRGGLGREARSQARQDRGRDHGRRCTPTRSRACTSWARTPRCRTPISTTRAGRWRISSTWWCRTSSSPRPPSYADVILPASAWPEKDGTVTNTNRQVQMGRKALPLPGDARQDLWIIQDLAQRMGSIGTTRASARCSPRWHR